MNRFYLFVLNNHIILCLQNYHMNSFVDVTAKRRHNQLSLHPSSDVSSPHTRYILGGGGVDSADQSLLGPHTLSSNLVHWVERSQSQTEYALCSFPRAWAFVFHSLLLMSPSLSLSSADVPSILNTD